MSTKIAPKVLSKLMRRQALFVCFQDLNLFMAGIQEKLTAILRPHRASPSADVKVNTVRMYGKSADTAPTGWIQKFDSAANKQSPDAMNTSPSSGKVSTSMKNYVVVRIAAIRNTLPHFVE